MKLYSKISVVFISLIILLSSTGILLVHHHCNHCNTDDWHLFSSINCKTEVFKPDCCSGNESEDCSSIAIIVDNHEKPCCSNDGLFFKLGLFNSNFEALILISCFESDVTFINYNFLDKIKSTSDFIYSDNSPPDLFKQIFLLNNSFRI
jgi:hypothetical protein